MGVVTPEQMMEMRDKLRNAGLIVERKTPSTKTPTPSGDLKTQMRADLEKAGLSRTPNIQTSQPQGPGAFQSFVQDVTKPFEKFGATALGLVQGTGNLIGAGMTKIAGGDPQAQLQKAEEAMTKERDFGYFGKARPIGINQDTGERLSYSQGIKDIAGTGTELFGMLAGPETLGIAGSAVKGTKALWPAVKEAGQLGLIGGGLVGAGHEAQKPESTASSIFGKGVEGSLTGLVTAPLFPIAGAGLRQVGKGAQFVREGFRPPIPEFAQAEGVSPSVGRYGVKALRPSVSGKGTFNQQQNWVKDLDTVAKEVVRNKDLFGPEMVGEKGIPETLSEFSKVHNSLKERVFAAYDGIKRLASHLGGSSTDIDLAPIISSLERQGAELSSSVIPEANKAGSRALRMAESMKAKGKLTLEQAQNELKRINANTSAFFKNPTVANAQKVAADNEIGAFLRKSLDDIIERETGGQYQELKNAYKALKTIEDDLNKRVIVDARKNLAGIIDFTNIFTVSDLVSAIGHLDPIAFTRAMAINSVRKFLKNLNDPNVNLRKMFEGLMKEDLGKSILGSTKERVGETVGKAMRGEGKPLMLPPPGPETPIRMGGEEPSRLFSQSEIAQRYPQLSPAGIAGRSLEQGLNKKPILMLPPASQIELPPGSPANQLSANADRLGVGPRSVFQNVKGTTTPVGVAETPVSKFTLQDVQKMGMIELRKNIKEMIEKYRKQSMKADKGISGRTLSNVEDATGNLNFVKTGWSLNKAKRGMKTQKDAGIKQAEQDLMEFDPVFRAMKDKLQSLEIPF